MDRLILRLVRLQLLGLFPISTQNPRCNISLVKVPLDRCRIPLDCCRFSEARAGPVYEYYFTCLTFIFI